MNEIEHRFQCPYCFEQISMVLDLSLDETQSYIEDCEVCCQPIEVTFEANDGTLLQFSARQA